MYNFVCRFWQYGFNQLSIEISFLFIFFCALQFSLSVRLISTSHPPVAHYFHELNSRLQHEHLYSYKLPCDYKSKTFRIVQNKNEKRNASFKTMAKSNGSQQLKSKTEYTLEIQPFGVIVLIKFSYRLYVARALINYIRIRNNVRQRLCAVY